jgi:hypothetical protein
MNYGIKTWKSGNSYSEVWKMITKIPSPSAKMQMGLPLIGGESIYILYRVFPSLREGCPASAGQGGFMYNY